MRSSDIRHVHAMVMLVTGVLACAAGHAAAEHLGTIGPVHAIGEPDLMVEIDRTLRQATADGRLARFETEARSRILRDIEDPAPIAGITRATVRRTRYHDPSMVVPAAITDAAGRVVVAAGTVVNPLDTVTLSKPLLFFDGRDDGQVKRARELERLEKERTHHAPQADMFAAVASTPEPVATAPSPILEALAALDADDLSPREAHAKLAELIELARRG